MKNLRPPMHIRNEYDLVYEIQDQTVIIKEVRFTVERYVDVFVAKITFNREQKGWKLFGMNSAGEWEGMFSDLIPTFSDAIQVVEDDDIGIFFG
ncbi:DUF3024 domain-containing protein [Providencia rettgeri]|uniref:DUF3024 domain-containing protein n=2 Tax=Morganellaceae TaxID=1903414 RepID=UPI0022714E70|nr:DUF3024 domain-containing protein [Providencia rettgeri]MCX9126752.1 DUF3024 domain-containing protein [Providencia rettgeri]MCX9130564.1 DUF3024 domain-containing protein [Providencia rettgeri]HEM8127285.1 DUF3024 domain-containing protein [Providencia rettgeri]